MSHEFSSDSDDSALLGLSVGGALRHRIFNKITPILLSSDGIGDSQTRLMIQACCLDVVTALEDVITRFGLDTD